MENTPKDFANDVSAIVNTNDDSEMLYARKKNTTDYNGIYWRRDRVVTIKTAYPNAIRSVTFGKSTSSDHVNSDTNINNPNIDTTNSWTDAQIKTGDSTHKCAFYKKGTTNVSESDQLVITISLKTAGDGSDGFYYDPLNNPLSNNYFEATAEPISEIEINEVDSTKTVFTVVNLYLKNTVAIDNDIDIILPITPYRKLAIFNTSEVANITNAVYLNGTVKTEDNSIIQSYNYEILDSASGRLSRMELLVDQPVKIDLHVCSSLKGFDGNLDTAISNTTLRSSLFLFECFGLITSRIFLTPNSEITCTPNPVSKGSTGVNNVYLVNGYKELVISTNNNVTTTEFSLTIFTKPLYICMLKNSLTWDQVDHSSVCKYKLTDDGINYVEVDAWDSQNYTCIFYDASINGKETNKPYIALRVIDYTTSDPNIDPGEITVENYDYYNYNAGISETGPEYMQLYDNNSRYELYLSTKSNFDLGFAGEVKILRKGYTIDFILDKNGFTFDYYNWTISQLSVQRGDTISYIASGQDSEVPENRFITSIDDDKDVSFKAEIRKWYDTSQVRSSSEFSVPGFAHSNFNLGDFELSKNLVLGNNSIIQSGDLTMTTLDYALNKIITLNYDYDKISEIRISKFTANNATFPVIDASHPGTVTRFNRTSGFITNGPQVTYLADISDGDQVYLWIKTKSREDSFGNKYWLYLSRGFFNRNNLITAANAYKVEGIGSNNLPCIINHNGVEELWFLTTIQGGGSHTFRTINPPVITEDGGNTYTDNYPAIDLYIIPRYLTYGSYFPSEDPDDKRYAIYFGDSTSSSTTRYAAKIDILKAGEKSTHGNRLLYASNVYWSCCNFGSDTYQGDNEYCHFTEKYVDSSGTQPTPTRYLGYYLRTTDTLNNNNYGYNDGFYDFLHEWGGGLSGNRIERLGIQTNGTLTITFAAAFPKYISSGYTPTTDRTTQNFSAIYAGSIYNKTYSTNGFNEAYILPDDPDWGQNPLSNYLERCKMFGDFQSGSPRFAKSNALAFDLGLPWRFTVNE